MTAQTPRFPPPRRTAAPRRTIIGMAVALALAQYGMALAGPGGAQVVAGQVAISQPNAQQTVVTQGSSSAIVNWQQFSIARGEGVDFRQPGTASVILNRVTGNHPSEIYGRLSANGQVFLVNPGGVLFGRTAQVDVGGLVASTLDIADADFLSGRYRFTAGARSGAVANNGHLQAAERGTVALLGAKVNNDGTISAQLGTVALAAGDKVALDFNGDGLTKLRVDQAALAAQVENRGMLIADGGQAILTAHAAQALTETVLNQQGVVRARSLQERNGRILLDGGAQGESRTSGTLDVSGHAPGLTGGTAEVLGRHVGLAAKALVDARGDAGGGTILVGGDYRGGNPLVRNADATFAAPATALLADATGNGNGGKVIVWSDHATRMFGTVSATGGPGGGNGGLIETSGKFLSVDGARIDASAPRGRGGQWLLDPYSVTIGFGNTTNVRDAPNYVSAGSMAQIGYLDIENALNAGTSVSVTTGAGQGEGDINVDASIQKNAGGEAALRLNAARDINIAPEVSIAASALGGRLHVDFNADLDGEQGGAILMNSGSSIATNGGDLRMYGQGNPDLGRAAGRSVDRPNGVRLLFASIDTTSAIAGNPGGSVLMRGSGATVNAGGVVAAGAGVNLTGSGIRVSSGSVTLDGIAGAGANGVSLSGGVPFPPNGVSYAVQSDTGAVSIQGVGGAIGVALDSARVAASISRSGQPSLIVGGNGGGAGVRLLNNSILENSGGPINITGVGNTYGVALIESDVINRSNGAIDIRGRAGLPGETAPVGVLVSGGSDRAATIASTEGSGPIAISGETLANSPGIQLAATSVLGGPASGGDITLRAVNAAAQEDGGDMIRLNGPIDTSGAVTLVPGGVAASGALTEAPATPIDLFSQRPFFSLDQAELNDMIGARVSRVIIGSASHTGPITAHAGATLSGRYDLTLQNGGAGSVGIVLAGGLGNPGRMLTLSSGGTVSQNGPISVGSLLLHGTQPESNFQLADPLNAVGRFSAQFALPSAVGNPNFGDVNVVSAGDLEIGPLTGIGFDAAGNRTFVIAADAAVVAGDLFARAGRDLILLHNISTLGSDITLVAGHVFRNLANATLLPGGGGHWKVFADTWLGEQAGPLAGSGPNPNRYNCGYGAPCVAALPGDANMFVYRQQPRVDIALVNPNPARPYGAANPSFDVATSGLIKGDTMGTAVTGAYVTPATPGSNVQNYPIEGQFVSPAGYVVVAAPGTLRVDPATLTYVAAPSVRPVGRPGLPLTGSVSGLVNGDTLPSATTGTLNFSSAAGVFVPPGRYSVEGAGLSAANYRFVQAASNATALLVIPNVFGAPSISKDVTFESSALYGKNFGIQGLCAGTGPLARIVDLPDSNDPLAIEWARVRHNPNLSNCIGLVQRYSCDSF